MFKNIRKHVVIGTSGRDSVFDRLLLPNGERALLIDREAYHNALNAADTKFSEILKQMGSVGDRSDRRKPAA